VLLYEYGLRAQRQRAAQPETEVARIIDPFEQQEQRRIGGAIENLHQLFDAGARLGRHDRDDAAVRRAVRDRIELARFDLSHRDVELGRERQHVGNGLGVRAVSNQDHVKLALPRPQRREDRLPAFEVFHRRRDCIIGARCRCGSRRMREGFDSR
jgi:hypothetical protein